MLLAWHAHVCHTHALLDLEKQLHSNVTPYPKLTMTLPGVRIHGGVSRAPSRQVHDQARRPHQVGPISRIVTFIFRQPA